MPGRDGTGPLGLGPMTGGGRGLCNPYFGLNRQPLIGGFPYYQTFTGGFPSYLPYSPYMAYPYSHFGFGRGRGRGWRW
jgi:hypothetical protein